MKKLLLVSLCFLFFSSQIFAQNRTITGMVTAKDDGLPIPGVSVRIQGKQTGTQTGIDGKYSITVPSDNSVLIFSFIGYQPQSISVAGKGTISVSLTATSNELSEVVVTGVGVATEKRRVPIDVATVASKDFAKSAVVSASQALVGQIAGATVQEVGGQPGTSPIILLRGFTNLSYTAPLIIVDGVQADASIINTLDPSVIDHFEVVKGSAGGMLYGAQGGNGVIQIFTKKGQNGKMTIDFSSTGRVDNALEKNNLTAVNNHYVTNAAGQILDVNGNVLKQSANGTWPVPQEDVSGPNVVNNKPFNLPIYNHIKQIYNTAYTFSNSVNIRGGSEKSDYAFGLSNLNQQDVYSNNYDRTNLNLNLGFQPVKGLTIRNSTQVFFTHENLLSGSRFNAEQSYQFIDLKALNPITGKYVIKPNGNIDGNNVLAEKDYHQRQGNTPRILENINANYKFSKFFELDYKYSIDYSPNDNYDYYLNQSNTGSPTFFGPNVNGSIQDTYTKNMTQYSIASAYFRTDFKNDFNINLPIKTTTQASYDYKKENYSYYYIQGVSLSPYPPYNISGATTKTGGDYSQADLFYGFLVNQTIDYGNLFGISGGFRYDYSSEFGGADKPAFFPRGTVYFNPSELLKIPMLANWKIRGAYGKAGTPLGPYDRQAILQFVTLGSGTAIQSPNSAANPLLNVPVTTELELGTDVTIAPSKGPLFSRVTFSGSYWKRTSDNVEQSANVAPTTGFAQRLDNLISLSSHGVDLSADTRVYDVKNFTWNLGLRFAIAQTTITKLYNNTPIVSGAFELAVGQQVGILYGQTPLHSITQLQPNGTPYITAANQGFYTLVNGNVVDTRTNAPVITAANDLSNLGNTSPNFTSSMINSFTIMKKLTASFQFDWSHGNKIYNQTKQWLFRDKLATDFDTPVTINGKTGAFVNYYNGFYNTLNPISYFVEDGSFIRLRDASIGYDFTGVVHAKWIRTLGLTLSGRNLLTFTKYQGLDPENTTAVSSQGGGLGSIGSARGVDYFGVPNLRSYQFTLNIGF